MAAQRSVPPAEQPLFPGDAWLGAGVLKGPTAPALLGTHQTPPGPPGTLGFSQVRQQLRCKRR